VHKDTDKDISKRHLYFGTLSGRLLHRAVRPVLAGLKQAVPLLQQTSSEVAGKQSSTALINAIAGVLGIAGFV
jgi:hypothetical protein